MDALTALAGDECRALAAANWKRRGTAMPYMTRLLPPAEGTDPRTTMVLPRGPNLWAFLGMALALVVPTAIFVAGVLALVEPSFHLELASGLAAVGICGLSSVGAIATAIRAVRHAAGSREPAARRSLALVALGLGYLDVGLVIAFIAWTVLRTLHSLHIGG
jgi:hypothetical protein